MTNKNNSERIINLYYNNKDLIELDEILDCALELYYDETLNDMYPHKKKTYVITLFLKNIETILIKQINYKKSCFCFRKKEKKLTEEEINTLIHEFIYSHGLPIIIDELLLFRSLQFAFY